MADADISAATSDTTCTFRALGFCGADDSVHPNLLAIFCRAYPIVEFGVLFRPDKKGEPRYASSEWVEQLGRVVAKNTNMKLAAHLCGTRVNDVLNGKDDFLQKILSLGFRRVQINATAVNGVDVSRLGDSVPTFLQVVEKFPDLEFILQKNDETFQLWNGILENGRDEGNLPKNISMLVDESKGTGAAPASSWPRPPDEYEIGYAGGIGPHNIKKVLKEVRAAAGNRSIWIDMESSLRSTKNGKDVFDLDKCYEVIDAACELGVTTHPDYLADFF